MTGPGAPSGARAAVIGHPVSHSKSPLLHAAAYRLLEFDCSYTAVDVAPTELPAFMEQFRTDPAWYGLSVTMPHKAAALELVDEASRTAAALGVLNTVTATVPYGDAPRRLTGHNTDAAGIVGALRNAGVVAPVHSAVVLGGGGTAAAALAGLRELGADAVQVCVRSPERAASLLSLGERLGCDVSLQPWDGAGRAVTRADVVISTLPPHGPDALAGELGAFSTAYRRPVLLDVAYDPWPSALAQAWEARGGTVVPGLEMLIYQAVEQVRLFTAAAGFTGAFSEEHVINAMCDAVGAPRR
jgi:shikimate dehydrogenase